MSKFTAIIVTVVLSCVFLVGATFLVMNAKIKEERVTFSAMNADIKSRIIFLENKIKEIEEAQAKETYNGIALKMWVKANPQYGKRVAGKVIGFIYRGEAYPIAVLRGGKEISVFWLVPMKTQRG